MAATMVTIESFETSKDYIVICGVDYEPLLMCDDIDEQVELPTVTYRFERKNPAHNRYLLRILQSNSQAKDKKSLGEKLNALLGQFVAINSSFIVQA